MSQTPRSPQDPPASSGGGGTAEAADAPLVVHMVTSRAVELARAGRYDPALQLLAGLRFTPAQAPVVMDLCARIYAQQGLYPEALDQWNRVLARDPLHEGAHAGRRQVALALRRPPWLAGLLSWPVALGLTILAFALVLRVPGGEARSPALDLNADGILWKAEGNEVVARIEAPLFAAGSAELLPDGEARIADLARRLEPDAGRLSVAAIGVAPDPAQELLALRRAQEIVKRLQRTPKLARCLAAVSGVDDPFAPGAAELNPRVLLRIARLGPR